MNNTIKLAEKSLEEKNKMSIGRSLHRRDFPIPNQEPQFPGFHLTYNDTTFVHRYHRQYQYDKKKTVITYGRIDVWISKCKFHDIVKRSKHFIGWLLE